MATKFSTTRLGLAGVPTAAAIKRILRARLGHQWRVGDRLPPVKDLARLLGTGQSSTHQAVKELAAEGILESRQRRGTFVLRTPSLVASASDRAAQASHSVGVLAGRTVCIYCQEGTDGFVWRMVDGFSAAFAATGANVRTCLYPLNLTKEAFSIDPEDDAVVLFNPGGFAAFDCRPDQLMSVVTTTTCLPMKRNHRYDMVSIDELHGGALAGQHLRACGCREFCFLGRTLEYGSGRCDTTSSIRLCGLESTLGTHVDQSRLLLGLGYSPISGGKLFRQYAALSTKPDGIFAVSDDLAVGFVVAAASHGLIPGRDFKIVGFDGQDRGQAVGELSLTTVKVPAREMGKRAAQLLIERFGEPDRPVHRIQLECGFHQGATAPILSKE